MSNEPRGNGACKRVYGKEGPHVLAGHGVAATRRSSSQTGKRAGNFLSRVNAIKYAAREQESTHTRKEILRRTKESMAPISEKNRPTLMQERIVLFEREPIP